MFGLFNNKEEKQEKNNPKNSPEFKELVTKWDTFLTKMETRFNESLVHAEEALFENLIASDYDISPTMTAWSGIKSQLMQLTDKIDETFDEKVEPKMLEYVERYNLVDENHKGTIIRESMLDRIERYEIELEGKIGLQFYNHAINFLNEDFNCTQCNGKIEIKKDIFRSHYISCDYCNTVNTFTPSDKIAQIAWVADNIAKHNAIKEWDTKEKALKSYQELRSWSEGEDFSKHKIALEERERSERNYWLKYFKERSVLLPEYEDTIEHDTDVKMRHFYEYRQREFNY